VLVEFRFSTVCGLAATFDNGAN